MKIEQYYNDIPIGKQNAVDYTTLCRLWGTTERGARSILQRLSYYDGGDNLVLIRSAKNRGFYKTDDLDEIAAYRTECLHKGRSIFAAVSKCNAALAQSRPDLIQLVHHRCHNRTIDR